MKEKILWTETRSVKKFWLQFFCLLWGTSEPVTHSYECPYNKGLWTVTRWSPALLGLTRCLWSPSSRLKGRWVPRNVHEGHWTLGHWDTAQVRDEHEAFCWGLV